MIINKFIKLRSLLNTIALLIVFLGGWNYSGCRFKNSPIATPVQSIVQRFPDELQSYVSFDTGSWWIYVDSNYQKIDTQRIKDLYYGLSQRSFQPIGPEYDFRTTPVLKVYYPYLNTNLSSSSAGRNVYRFGDGYNSIIQTTFPDSIGMGFLFRWVLPADTGTNVTEILPALMYPFQTWWTYGFTYNTNIPGRYFYQYLNGIGWKTNYPGYNTQWPTVFQYRLQSGGMVSMGDEMKYIENDWTLTFAPRVGLVEYAEARTGQCYQLREYSVIPILYP